MLPDFSAVWQFEPPAQAVRNDWARVFAERLLVFAFDDGEGLQNVVHVVASDTVEVEVGRISLP